MVVKRIQGAFNGIYRAAGDTPLLDPGGQLLPDGGLRVSAIQEDDRRPVVLVTERPADCLIDRLHAEIRVELLPCSRLLLIQIAHLLFENHVILVGVGHSHDGDASSQIVAEVDALRQLASDHSKQRRLRILLRQIGRVLLENVLSMLLHK